MFDADKSKRRIVAIGKKIALLKQEAKTLGLEIQANCKHKNIIESPKKFSIRANTLRLCVDCGMVDVDFFGYDRLFNARCVSADEYLANNTKWVELIAPCK